MRDVKPRVCRRLQFDSETNGPEDSSGASDNLQNFIQEELQKDREAAKLRWNFDFENEVPLPGRWVWEPVTSANVVPPTESATIPPEQEHPAQNENAPERQVEPENQPGY